MKSGELLLLRKWKVGDATIGELSDGAELHVFTLEDEVRLGDILLVKIPGQTAIPEGRYRIALSFSPRFNREMPILYDVLDFTDIRIHGGNTADDVKGCIAVGWTRTLTGIADCRPAMEVVVSWLLRAKDASEPCWIEIRNAFEDTEKDPTLPKGNSGTGGGS